MFESRFRDNQIYILSLDLKFKVNWNIFIIPYKLILKCVFHAISILVHLKQHRQFLLLLILKRNLKLTENDVLHIYYRFVYLSSSNAYKQEFYFSFNSILYFIGLLTKLFIVSGLPLLSWYKIRGKVENWSEKLCQNVTFTLGFTLT